MSFHIRRADYYYATVVDRPGEGYRILSQLAGEGVSLMAFTGVPLGPEQTQFTLFPDDPLKLIDAAQKAGLALDGPHRALLVQGDDEPGALVEIHTKLHSAKVNVYASNGVSDGRGGFGYTLYVRPEQYETAAAALDI